MTVDLGHIVECRDPVTGMRVEWTLGEYVRWAAILKHEGWDAANDYLIRHGRIMDTKTPETA